MSEQKITRIKQLVPRISGVSLLTQYEQAIPQGLQPIPSERKEGEEHFGTVYKTSTFMSFPNGDYRGPDSNELDDYAVTGYTSLGLPFHINLDGYHGAMVDPAVIAKFAHEQIIPLMDVYAIKLSAAGLNSEAIMRQLIADIEQARQAQIQKNPSLAFVLRFTLSLGIGYQLEDRQYYAGFGIGDVGLILHRVNESKSEVLTYRTVPQGPTVKVHKDGFDDVMQQEQQPILARADFFNVPVGLGDESFGYTSVLPEFEDKPIITQEARKYSLNSEAVESKGSLLETVFTKNQENYTKILAQASEVAKEAKRNYLELNANYCSFKEQFGEKDLRTKSVEGNLRNFPFVRYGDDCTMSAIHFPSVDKQQAIQDEIYQEISEHLARRPLSEFRTQNVQLIRTQLEQSLCAPKPKAKSLKIRILAATYSVLVDATYENIQQYLHFSKKIDQVSKDLGQSMSRLGSGLIAGGALISVPQDVCQEVDRRLQEKKGNLRLVAIQSHLQQIQDEPSKILVTMATDEVLTKPTSENIQTYIAYARVVNGGPSIVWKGLGASMIALGSGLIPAGALALEGRILEGMENIDVISASAIAVGGIAVILGAVGMFYGRQKGLSKEMRELGESIQPIVSKG